MPGRRRDQVAPAHDAAEALAARARYSRWDGTQQTADLEADEILDALADDVLAEGDLAQALRRLMEHGWRTGDATRGDLVGLRDLLERLEHRREELLERYQLGDVLGDIRRELEEIVDEERAGVQRRLDEASRDPGDGTPDHPPTGVPGSPADTTSSPPGAAPPGAPTSAAPTGAPTPNADLRAMLRDVAARRLDQLDALPPDVGERIRGLQDYDFLEPGARERFDELVKRLQQQVLDQYVAGMSGAIRSMTPDDLAANREMVRDLNELIRERIAGGDPDVSEFLARHGRFFPGARTFDDIIEQLTQRMAAMQSLLRSMSPEQRAELQSMMEALLRDDRLLIDLAQLAANLDMLLPGGLGERVPFEGEEPLGLDGALAQIGRLQAIDRMEETLAGIESPGDLAAIDHDEVRNLLGDDAVRELDALEDLAHRLEEAGYLTRDGEHLQLTPRGNRRIGQKVLDDLFARLQRDAFGGHRLERAGRGGERDDTTKPYEFGDPFHLDLRETLFNALGRDENAPANRVAERPVRLDPDDFAVHRTELLTQTSTVLLVDMSRSMLLRGCFLAAKKVAVALDTLIRTQYPRDHLSVIGFAYYAREIPPGALAELTWHGYEYGTNLQHGLLLARRTLERHAASNKEIVVITDGEPTAHFEDGQVEFNYPPTRRTISETLREVQRCTKAGITINTFMLERSRALAEFVAHMTRLNRGRAFYASPEHLGEYVLVDFVSRRTKHVA
ncbi:MAG: VWA domain-containing protein [Chloroflexota bacterium]